jgi:TRAP-type mannitol/chloroaromatic compound transport system permease small subunit
MSRPDLIEGAQVLPHPKGTLDRIVTRVEQISITIAAFAIFALMITAVFQVVARYAFNAPIRGYIDYVEQASAILAFAAVGYAEHVGAHIRMEFVPQKLVGWARRTIEVFGLVIGFALVCALIYATWFNFLRAWQIGDTSMDVELAIWPGKLIVPIALFFLGLRMMIALWREFFGNNGPAVSEETGQNAK